MINNLETKIEENLPAIRQEDELAKLANEASALETFTANIISSYICGLLITNVALFNDPSSYTKYDVYLKKYTWNKPQSSFKKCLSYLGLYMGTLGAVMTEYALFDFAISCGIFGADLYLGAKVFTHNLGYKHYKKRKEKHAELKNIYLLEKNDK